MNILFDTNILLDAMLDRDRFGENAVILLDAVEKSLIAGCICAHSVTTLYYLIEKVKSGTFARQKVKLLLEIFEVAPVNRAVLEEALGPGFSDYEDAVVHQAAVEINADGIVTRNTIDFKNAKIAVYSPSELIAIIQNLFASPRLS